MCEIGIKIFNKSENHCIARKSRGLANFFLQWRAGCLGGELEKFCCTGGAEPLGGARISRGAESLLDSMMITLFEGNILRG